MTEIPRVTKVGERKNGLPVVVCPECGCRVAVGRDDRIVNHDKTIALNTLRSCGMGWKEVHLIIPKTEKPRTEASDLPPEFTMDREIDKLIERIKARYPKQAMSGKVTCPECKVKHALKISQVVHRGQGRIRAFCETDGCIRVME